MPRTRVLLMILLTSALGSDAWAEPAPAREATVTHVDDGDTIDVWVDGRRERVRYIGIDAPEVAHDGVGGARGGRAATRLNQALVGGRQVRLELDRERRDRYGRLLAYVWSGRVMINLELVRRGYARVLTIPPNVRYERWFVRAQAEAQAAHRGLWGDGDPDVPVSAPGGRPRSWNARPCLADRGHRAAPRWLAVMRTPGPRQAVPVSGRRSTAGPREGRRSSRLPRIPFGRKMMNTTSRMP